MCAFSLPFALSRQASIAVVSLALRKSFVICPLRNRNRSAPVTRNLARAERSRKKTRPVSDPCVILVRTRVGSAAVLETHAAPALQRESWRLRVHSRRVKAPATPQRPSLELRGFAFPLLLYR